MKKSDIYEVAVKILGLYLIIVVIRQLRDVLAYASIVGDTKTLGAGGMGPDPKSLFWITILGFLLAAAVAFILLFRTKRVTRAICDDRDYQETAKLFADRKTVYEIALVLAGLITLIQTVPDFTVRLRNYVQLVQSKMLVPPYDTHYLTTAAIEVVLGLVAVFCCRPISALLGKSATRQEGTD